MLSRYKDLRVYIYIYAYIHAHMGTHTQRTHIHTHTFNMYPCSYLSSPKETQQVFVLRLEVGLNIGCMPWNGEHTRNVWDKISVSWQPSAVLSDLRDCWAMAADPTSIQTHSSSGKWPAMGNPPPWLSTILLREFPPSTATDQWLPTVPKNWSGSLPSFENVALIETGQ